MSTTDRTFAVHEVYAYLRVRDAAQALDFYKRAFGAEELFRLTEPSGRIGHAEIKLGGTTLMLSDEYPEMGIVGPQALGGTSFSIHLHVDNADAWIERAVAAGATVAAARGGCLLRRAQRQRARPVRPRVAARPPGGGRVDRRRCNAGTRPCSRVERRLSQTRGARPSRIAP